MTVFELYEHILSERYFHTKAAASYRLRRTGECTLHILFEWSNGALDWKNNLRATPERCVLGGVPLRVHRGFLSVYRSVRERLLAALSDVHLHRVLVAGYSHGAALANLAYIDLLPLLCDRGVRTAGFGFGCPRVLWGRVPSGVAQGFLAVRCGRDIVTHLPPKLLGYTHAGQLVRLPTREPLSAIDAHRPASYRASLAATDFGASHVFSHAIACTRAFS